jgi:SAM-dependent methyltransferase
MFVLSGSLKWASRQSHLRGKIVEGWAMHAYWIYPKSLEMNVWNIFKRRYDAVLRGKQYGNREIGAYCKFANRFDDLLHGGATCFILNRSASELPMRDESVDVVITDPPYGGNVNYAELSDFWYIWMSQGRTIEKAEEVIVNRTQEKSLEDYQALLESVFKECYRVLKPSRHLVSTFNSKDFRVVASFVVAASKAGFALRPDDVKYQAPIRPYMTTFHAMQVGAFVGDFVFTFTKEKARPTPLFEEAERDRICMEVSRLVDESVRSGRLEPTLRERAYELLIPFLAKYGATNPIECRNAAEFFERKIRENDSHFKKMRKRLVEDRRRVFRSKKRNR